ncbi:ISPg7, transposase [uncultured Gammaproteobacteria bacterium]|nr:ISPg7, transposase [uncultured Gammaproteobacteria bacterium]
MFATYQKDFLLYQQVLAQKPKDKNKIYSLHEANVYVIAKGKDHKQYEYGNKVSIVSTKDSNIIVGVVSHNKNIHDSKTLHAAIGHAKIAIEIKTSPLNRQYAIEVMLVQKRYWVQKLSSLRRHLNETIVISTIKSTNCVKDVLP